MDEDELNNFDLDPEEEVEIHSTTECTTNDEMELESVSAKARRLNRMPNIIDDPTRPMMIRKSIDDDFSKKTLIDDYLGVENMEKEEILAAKINKFLSVKV